MSKRTSKQLNQQTKNTTTQEKSNEKQISEEKIVKKSFNSATETTPTTTTITAKESVKLPAKMTLTELKNLKNLRKKQEVILMDIDNNNIQKHVSKLIEKFDPPQCINCPNRRADRVCINKPCGVGRYMQIICGKCHFQEHQSIINKPEIDVEEYFIKLSTFMNESKYADSKKSQQSIDLDNLEKAFEGLDEFREKLSSLKSKIEQEIESYSSPSEMQGLLNNSITKALSLCEYDNIQEQLVNVKKSVLFQKNKFLWNDAGEKLKSFQNIFRNLDNTTNQVSQSISKSFIGGSGMEICLDDVVVKKALNSSNQQYNIIYHDFKGKDGELKIEVPPCTGDRQFYLDYNLDPKKKYKLRFRFDTAPSYYMLFGVMEKKQCFHNYVSLVPNQYFLKKFLANSPSEECSRILRGTDLSVSPIKGQQIEMRIDIENNYVDFYDYPEMKNVNASLLGNKFTNEDYVIVVDFYQSAQTIVLESFCEIFEIIQI